MRAGQAFVEKDGGGGGVYLALAPTQEYWGQAVWRCLVLCAASGADDDEAEGLVMDVSAAWLEDECEAP